jgi:hypothetical protein
MDLSTSHGRYSEIVERHIANLCIGVHTYSDYHDAVDTLAVRVSNQLIIHA